MLTVSTRLFASCWQGRCVCPERDGVNYDRLIEQADTSEAKRRLLDEKWERNSVVTCALRRSVWSPLAKAGVILDIAGIIFGLGSGSACWPGIEECGGSGSSDEEVSLSAQRKLIGFFVAYGLVVGMGLMSLGLAILMIKGLEYCPGHASEERARLRGEIEMDSVSV